jgi:IMP cyclohydrolase
MNRIEELAKSNLQELGENPYPGRGIVQGVNPRGDEFQQAYWVMGRSENSRNRILVENDGIVRTEAFDPSKVTDPSLIIYNAMRAHGDIHIASNGDQTDTVIDFLKVGKTFKEALETRTYEPDAPNYTPRITAFVELLKERFATSGISIIRKSIEYSEEPVRQNYTVNLVATETRKGIGDTVHTYSGDGDPLPSFDQPPYPIPLAETIDETAETLWSNLDKNNRVALVVKGIHLATGDVNFRIINAHERQNQSEK